MLYGLQPTPPAKARVLELGCGTGGNIIPMADEYKQATFVGVDLGEEHIRSARAFSSELGLTNISFKHQSVTEL